MARTLRYFLVWIYLTLTFYSRPCFLAENLALNKPASQIGTWSTHSASKAVDGDNNQKLSDNSCAHPQSDESKNKTLQRNPAWWSVDLANGDPHKTYIITNLTIYFRNDCCGGDRIINNNIWIGDMPGTDTGQTLCAHITSKDSIQRLSCASTNKGVRYLTIMHSTELSLGICEVIVAGHEYQPCPSGKWGEDCTSDCHCEYSCNGIAGDCKDCPSGYFGKGCIGTCNCYDGDEVCTPRDGVCKNSGCATGYHGSNCSVAVPAMKQAPSKVSVTTTSITLDFPPSMPPGDLYVVEYTEDADVYYQRGAETQDSNTNSFRLVQSGLKPNTKYRFRIIPFLENTRGLSSPSLIASTNQRSVETEPKLNPEAVTTSTTTRLQFMPSIPAGDEYIIEFKIGKSGKYQEGTSVLHSSQGIITITQSQLQPNTKYWFRIVSYLRNTRGLESDPLVINTPEFRPSFESNPWISESTMTSVTINFNVSAPVPILYQLLYKKDSEYDYYEGEWVDFEGGTSTLSITQNGLQQNTKYYIKVTAQISPQGSVLATSNVVTISTKGSVETKPILNRVAMTTSTTTTLQFMPSRPAGDEYRIEFKIGESGKYQEGTSVQRSSQGIITITQSQLQPNTKYWFRIVSYLRNTRGLESDPLVINTPEFIPSIQSTPWIGQSNETSVTIYFNVSNPVAVLYGLEYKTSSENIYQIGASVKYDGSGAEILSIIQSNLKQNTSYDFRIVPYTTSRHTPGTPSMVISRFTQAMGIPPLSTTTNPTTKSEAPKDSRTGEQNAPNTVIIAVVVVILILVFVALLVLVFVRRSRSGKPIPLRDNFSRWSQNLKGKVKSKDPEAGRTLDTIPEGTDTSTVERPTGQRASAGSSHRESNPAEQTENVPEDPRARESGTVMPTIPVGELTVCIQNMKNTPDAFRDEFKKLPIGPTAKCNVGNKPENKNKNRFLNIRAYDHSRVILEPLPGDIHSDYINADYLLGYGGVEHVFIAAQGPKKGQCVDDMWRMVWQTNSNRIVMVTNVVEGGKIKCEQYWPKNDSATYGDIKVTLLSIDNYASYFVRRFNVEYENESRTIRQFHFTSWPDHGVPTVATDLLEFRKRIKSFDKEATGPLIIHCSAGVGRTGTYIAVDTCLEQAKQEGGVNIWEVTRQMRRDRVNMIQTLDQYIFVYDAIHEALLSGDTSILASQFKKEYTRLCHEDPETNMTPLSVQFKTLEKLQTPRSDTKQLVALESDNINKNRFKEIIPSNRYRPFLSTLVDDTTSYINAVYVDSFQAKLAYIVTQMPLQHTVVDFWRLIHDHHSSTIIMLNSLDKNDKDMGIYWPEEKDQTLNFGPLEVTMTLVDTTNPHTTIREFNISNSKTRRTQHVRQFQLNSWSKEDMYPEDRASLLHVMTMAQKWQQQSDNGPVTIHCMNGANRCGMFVATMYATEQLKVDHEIDVYSAVKQIRIPRPEFIHDIDQYKFVHEMMLQYMSDFDDYSNFA